MGIRGANAGETVPFRILTMRPTHARVTQTRSAALVGPRSRSSDRGVVRRLLARALARLPLAVAVGVTLGLQLLGEVLAGLLVDDLHREADLAALVLA